MFNFVHFFFRFNPKKTDKMNYPQDYLTTRQALREYLEANLIQLSLSGTDYLPDNEIQDFFPQFTHTLPLVYVFTTFIPRSLLANVETLFKESAGKEISFSYHVQAAIFDYNKKPGVAYACLLFNLSKPAK